MKTRMVNLCLAILAPILLVQADSVGHNNHDDRGHAHGRRCTTKALPKEERDYLETLIRGHERNLQSSGKLKQNCVGCVNIDTYFHIFQSTRPSVFPETEENFIVRISEQDAQSQFDILVKGFQGSPFVFTLKKVNFVENQKWFENMDEDSVIISQQYRIGGWDTLNVYFGNNGEGSSASYPSQNGDYDEDDGAYVDITSMPGVSPFEEYQNMGKTVVHEVGHWLGLHHTFDSEDEFDEELGGQPCSVNNLNDYIDDTAQQRDSTDECPADGFDTCPNIPGVDPIHNYMDYSNDECVTEFTPGQWNRMYLMWSLFRQQDETCGLGHVLLEIEFEITTNNVDEFEINWRLEADDGSLLSQQGGRGSDIFAQNPFEFYETRVWTGDLCIESSKQYVFTIASNENGEGLSGGNGVYRIRLDSELITEEIINFGSDHFFEFFAENLVLTPAPAATPPSFNICFSGDTVVTVEDDRSSISMRDLKVGDRVLSQSGRYERVYSFGHRDEGAMASFLQFLPSKLELSQDHMVYILGRGFLPAVMVKVGDQFHTGEVVETIRRVVRQGIFAPFTSSGTLIVNNALSSSYVAYQGSNKLQLASYETPFSYQWLAHTFLTPYRLWCTCYFPSDENATQQKGVPSFLKYFHAAAVWLLEDK